jgi:hypothetical protein
MKKVVTVFIKELHACRRLSSSGASGERVGFLRPVRAAGAGEPIVTHDKFSCPMQSVMLSGDNPLYRLVPVLPEARMSRGHGPGRHHDWNLRGAAGLCPAKLRDEDTAGA